MAQMQVLTPPQCGWSLYTERLVKSSLLITFFRSENGSYKENIDWHD